jgi:Cd2+/Zn2+-exporting ATPase
MIAEFALGLPLIGWPLVFFLATYFFGGFFTFRTAIASTLRGKFEVDFLMLVAAIGAALIGRWAEGAVLLFLFSLGHALEEYASAGPASPSNRLPSSPPQRAGAPGRRRAGGGAGGGDRRRRHRRHPPELPHSLRRLRDLGVSAVDQSAVTGESIPVEKEPVADPERAMRTVDTLPAANRVRRHRERVRRARGRGHRDLRGLDAQQGRRARPLRRPGRLTDTAVHRPVPALVRARRDPRVAVTLLISWLAFGNRSPTRSTSP